MTYELTTSSDEYVCDLSRAQALLLVSRSIPDSAGTAAKELDACIAAGKSWGLGQPRIRAKSSTAPTK